MKSNCGKKYEKRASRKKIWAYAVGAIMVFTAGTFAPSDRGFAAEKNILETRLRGGVDNPNPAGGSVAPVNVLPKGFSLQRLAEGIEPLENPSGKITLFGFLSDGTRTEPDENTYLVLDHNPGGPTPGFD